MKAYGRRIRNKDDEILWCGLTGEEVVKALKDNVRLNSVIYQQCLEEAQGSMNVKEEHDQVSIALNPGLRQECRAIAATLFAQCAVKSFVALKEALEEKVHLVKSSSGDEAGSNGKEVIS